MSNYDPKLVGAVTDKGLYRAENEDALWQPDHTSPVQLGALYIVADGVGGQEHGAIAARITVAVLSEAFYRAREQGQDIPQALEFGVAQANQAVFDEAQLSGLRMGATVVTAVHYEGHLYVAHVGDSRAYLVAGQKLKPLTRDDSLVQKQLDAGIITPAEAAKHEFRNLVTQVLGNTLEIDIHLAEPQPFGEGDAMLLCSDGLSGVVAAEVICDIVAENPAPAAAKALIQAAKDAGSQDNITAVVVEQSSHHVHLVPTPTAADKPKRERSVWLWAGMVIFLIVVTGLLWWRGQQSPGGGADEATPNALVLPLVDNSSPTPELMDAEVVATAVVEPTNTPPPALTSQAESVETAVPTIEAATTLAPEPTATLANMGCVEPNIVIVFVWTKEDLTLETCAGALAQLSLTAGEPVLLLQATPEALSVPGNCSAADFVEVQSQVDETLTGWVLESQILRDEACR